MTKGSPEKPAAVWTQRQGTASPGLLRVRQKARQGMAEPFTALLHHVTPALLESSYYALKRNAAPGVDGITWEAYGGDLEANLQQLHDRLHGGRYRAMPARRVYIDKADGAKPPLSILCLEDKIAQQALVQVLNAIYEEEFLGFSYGFRPGRSQHQALDDQSRIFGRTSFALTEALIIAFCQGIPGNALTQLHPAALFSSRT